MEGRYSIVDVETTGFSPREDRVVEVACVVLDGALREVAAFSSLVDPGRAIPHYATAVHGIRDRDVAGAPALASLRGRLRALTAGTTVVAHNASFDRRFLDCLDDREWLCTLKLARRAFPEAPAFGNQFLRRYLGIDDPRLRALTAHRAYADAIVTAGVLRACLTRLRLAS
jgi:DNA polymerase III epsilon subunit-like protein